MYGVSEHFELVVILLLITVGSLAAFIIAYALIKSMHS